MSAAGGGEGGPTWARRRLVWALAAAVLLAGLLALGVFLSWHFSSAVLVPDRSEWSEEVDIEDVGPARLVLHRSEVAMGPGYYGLVWQGGHAVVGPVLESDRETVTRRLSDVHGYLAPGTEAGLESEVYAGDPREARGLPFRNVEVRGELGLMPAWLIPGRTETWAIVVHGINADPQVGLRIAPALRRAGLASLLITYRDDRGAPSSPDGLHHMGLTEWRDLQAAARHALSHGAARLVLIGYSMGGAIVTQFMENSRLASRVVALVLDAPVLDWKETIGFNATQMGLPRFFAMPVEWAIGARIDADWDSLDAVRHREDLQLPILLFHGEEDDLVPIETSDEFAEELAQWVRYYRVPDAGHTQAWNVDPRLYARRIGDFLSGALPLGKGAGNETSPTKGSGSKK